VSLMGIRNIALAINKMDLVGYDQTVFDRIVDSYEKFAEALGFASITAIPLSALKGDNMTVGSANMLWYSGPTLMRFLETVEVAVASSHKLVLPVQWVNRPNLSFRGFCGNVADGTVSVGDEIRVTASGQTATVAEIVSMDGPRQHAAAGDAITLTLDREIDASRGDVLSLAHSPLETTDQFEATVVWMNEEAGLVGRSYDIKLATQWAAASITDIKHRIDVNTLAHEASKKLSLNDISVCNLATSKPVVFDSYQSCKTLGSFILVDKFSHATVAVGMIHHTLRRAQNVHKQALSVTRADRARLNGHQGKVVWFTGLSGSGKSTIANALEIELHAQGRRTYILDGDNIRQGLNRDLGFTDADRV
jgi:bifunctional enzyme CysN/CysC